MKLHRSASVCVKTIIGCLLAYACSDNGKSTDEDVFPSSSANEVVQLSQIESAGGIVATPEDRAADVNLDSYLNYYFAGEPSFDETIPSPDEILGFNPGDLHITPEALFAYVSAVATASSRAKIETIGYSHERRPLTHLFISSPDNIENLEEIRRRHLEATSPDEDVLVLELAYSIHGNEPSGSNAVPLIAYYLTASDDPWVTEFLERTVVIIEPSQNPDGLTRFAQWANTHRALVENYDDERRIQHQAWPSGRTNHYWFDLNRDWIFLVHPESQARIREYQRWKPHVLGDYHEMGGDKPSYFFQPGHPKRTHPLTLDENQRITAALAKFHAAALDAAGQDYYSQERFDDFYYGKGSTYPDIAGGIGLLFEQTAVRGLYRDFDGERLTFRQSIANQIATSFSLMRGVDALRDDILAYRFAFKAEEERRAGAARIKGYIFSDDGDPARARAIIDMLSAHGVFVYALEREFVREGRKFTPGRAWVVPADASQYGLVTSLFETRTDFEDNVFYDVSTWNLPMAVNLPYVSVGATANLLGERARPREAPLVFAIAEEAIAYAVPWNQLEAPKLLEAMLGQGIFPRVAAKPFGADLVGGERKQFDAGTLIVRLRNQGVRDALKKASQIAPNVTMTALASGLTFAGPDLGSRDMKAVRPVALALLVGPGVSTTEAGEIWHLFDTRVGAPVTLLDLDRVGGADLSKYTHILMADGEYEGLEDDAGLLQKWVSDGGVLIAQKRGANWVYNNVVGWVENSEIVDSAIDKELKMEGDATEEIDEELVYRAYQDYERDNGERLINGSVFIADADLTHPFLYGFSRPTLPLFRTWSKTLEPAEISYDTPLRYTDEPLLAGFAAAEKREEIAGTPALATHRLGGGHIVAIADNLNFRGLWRGSSRIYLNAIYFTQTIEERKDD